MEVNTEQPPKSADKHTQADFIELLCLVNLDGEVSQIDVYKRLNKEKDLDQNFNYLEEELEGELELNVPQAQVNDNLLVSIQQTYQHLAYRIDSLGDAYPFVLDDDRTTLRKRQVLSSVNRLYIYLLLASSLRSLNRTDRAKITDAFEILCVEVMKRYLPENANVHRFGKNSADYPPKKKDKIKALAVNIHESVKFREDDIKELDMGDAGLDIVAWVSFNDGLNGFALFFGQCACTEEWSNKQHSSSYEAWSGFIDLRVRPMNVIFIPFFFRATDGRWYRAHDIHMSILIDRVRIMNILKDVADPIALLPDSLSGILDQATGIREDIV